jgi:hypothetical protein
MNQIKTTAMICLDDNLGFTYKVSKLEYVLNEDESFLYIFTPNYSVIDLLTSDLFQGIPGLDLDRRKPQYVRENVTPVFISERTPGENREDLWKLLGDCNMDYQNRLEWLIRTHTRYGGDRLYAVRWNAEDEKTCVNYTGIEKAEPRSAAVIQRLLQAICAGHDIMNDIFIIDDSNRKVWYSVLISLYRKEKHYIDKQRAGGIKIAAAQGHYRGRKPAQIDDTKLFEVMMKYRSGKMTVHEAAAELGVSRSSFFRKLKKYEII